MSKMISLSIILFVGIQHLLFMVLEMRYWEKPLGLKIFKNTPEKAKITAVLAKNQGIYNGCFAGGLLWSLFLSGGDAVILQKFILLSIVVCGITGGLTVSRKIFWIQALPALVGLGFLHL